MPLQNTKTGRPAPDRARSSNLFRRGQRVFPAGVTRATIEKDPLPIYLERGEGSYVVDVDGNRLLDLNNNFTTLIHGHGFGPVVEAIGSVLRQGTCFANPMEHEIALAELLVSRIPAVEHVRFVNTGTEAVMYALKAARAFTGRSSIVRFEGAYHGGYDWAEAGQNGVGESGVSGRRPPKLGYTGAPKAIADSVIVLDFNDASGFEAAVGPVAAEVAAILVDLMPSRAGLLHPSADFIAALTATARKHGIVIVADEVLNLRQGFAGASARYGLEPDLVAAGKIIGGGFPIGAIGGRADVMAVFGSDDKAPLVLQGGTFSANPVSMIAGRIAMEALTPDAFDRLGELGDRVRNGLTRTISRRGAPFSVSGAASLFRIHPKKDVPATYKAAQMSAQEVATMRALTRHFLAHGILLPFGAAACLSTPMTAAEMDRVVAVFDDFLAQCEPSDGDKQ
ncbi:aspartate aminotransferase family protein [Mesorhizobium sp.]|uniref:aspartate aminotransferase family protein n=1 Tax=Mesorhizobium sp. TaxID=1871066 RepID=UPI00120C93B1|nr:aspartate aminotransferase family protein [Mesorhizobium sp.]TIQ44588.1 MAG: aspartate aminotransferase family protein [Mesorhizobium sp.]TIQ56045.1 MAG: aspartate aminotransferase family protein [Mesorhizobium sp.]